MHNLLVRSSQSRDISPIENLWVDLRRCVWVRRSNIWLSSISFLSLEEWTKPSSTILWETICERKPKTLATRQAVQRQCYQLLRKYMYTSVLKMSLRNSSAPYCVDWQIEVILLILSDLKEETFGLMLPQTLREKMCLVSTVHASAFGSFPCCQRLWQLQKYLLKLNYASRAASAAAVSAHYVLALGHLKWAEIKRAFLWSDGSVTAMLVHDKN